MLLSKGSTSLKTKRNLDLLKFFSLFLNIWLLTLTIKSNFQISIRDLLFNINLFIDNLDLKSKSLSIGILIKEAYNSFAYTTHQMIQDLGIMELTIYFIFLILAIYIVLSIRWLILDLKSNKMKEVNQLQNKNINLNTLTTNTDNSLLQEEETEDLIIRFINKDREKIFW